MRFLASSDSNSRQVVGESRDLMIGPSHLHGHSQLKEVQLVDFARPADVNE